MDATRSSGEEPLCCLCRSSLMEGTMPVKRKVFHGKACEVAKQLIDYLLNEQWQMSVMSFKEMIDSANLKAYICHTR